MPNREENEKRSRECQAADNRLINIVVIAGLTIVVLLIMTLGNH